MYYLLLLPMILFSVVLAFEKDITFTVQAGKTDCFYHTISDGNIIDIEYQVIDSSHGDLDISFQLADPVGRVLIADYKKSENSHRHTTTLAGDYRFCFDNTFSTFSDKTVFFDMMFSNENEPQADYDDKEMELGDAAETYMMRVRDISESVSRLRDHVTTARRLQEIVSAHEARDRNIAEDVNERVQRWSIIQIILMFAIGLFQVYFVRSLFEDSSNRRSVKDIIPNFLH